MKTSTSRIAQFIFSCCLIAASLAMAGCSHRPYSQGGWDNGIRNRRLSDRDMAHFSDSLRFKTDDAGYHYQLGRHFQQRGKHSMAINEFMSAIQLDPLLADVHNAMGVSYDKLLQFDLAEQCYRWALVLKPDFAAAYNNLGYSYLMQGKPQNAIEPLRKAVDLQKSNIRFHNNLGLAYKLDGQFEKAAAEFKRSGLNMQAHAMDAAGPDTPVAFVSTEASHNGELNRNDNRLPLYLSPLKPSGTQTPAGALHPDAAAMRQQSEPEGNASQVIISNAEPEPVWAAAQIEIANGNGVYRMASNLGRYLEHKGFEIHRLTNADRFEYPRTRIYYSDGQRLVACNLSQLLFGPEITCDLINSGQKYGQVKILIGEDVAGLNDLFSGRLKIKVANGNGVKHIAGRLSAYFRSKGFYVVNPTNAGHFGYQYTHIVYPEGQLANAQFLAREFPENCSGHLVMDERKANTIYVVLGKDFVF